MANLNEKLSKLIDDLRRAEKDAALDVSAWPDHRTRPSAQLRKNAAAEQVVALQRDYKNLARSQFFRVFVGGERAKEFAEYAARGGAVVVNGAELYENFAKAIAQSQDPREPKFGPHQQLLLIGELGTYARQNQYNSLMAPQISSQDLDTLTPTFDDLVTKVRRAVRATNLDDLNRLHLEKKIIEQALAIGACTSTIPVVITGLTDEEVQEMLKSLFGGTPAIDLTASKDTTDESLLKTINAKIRSVKANQTK